jgi:hypothetical protein
MSELKDYEYEQMKVRNSFEAMLGVYEIRKILGVSHQSVIELIKRGDLEAYNIMGKPVKRSVLTEDHTGLRILPSSLQSYLNKTKLN